MKITEKLLLALILLTGISVFFLTYGVYTKKLPLLTIVQIYPRDVLTIPRSGELVAGDVVKGEFRSYDNFLGIIEIRFDFFERLTNDTYVFRIKEKSEKDWYHTNTYKAKEFGGYPLFPFGFPTIADSRNKEYYFELESLYGKPGHGVGISTTEPVIETRHTFNKEYLLSHKEELLVLILKKIKDVFYEKDIFLPFIFLCVLLIVSIFVRINIPHVTVFPLISRLGQYSKKEANIFVRLFMQLQVVVLYILIFFLRKLYSFHHWLGEKE